MLEIIVIVLAFIVTVMACAMSVRNPTVLTTSLVADSIPKIVPPETSILAPPPDTSPPEPPLEVDIEDMLNPVDLRVPLEPGNPNMDKWLFVPMGMRCTPSSVKRFQLGIESATYVFDWCQMNVDTMRTILGLQEEDIEPFFRQHMYNLVDRKHPADGSWFPHDSEDFEGIVAKYTRRTKRLLLDLRSDKPKLLVTVTSPYEHSNVETCHKLQRTLSEIIPNSDEIARFVFVSATKSSYRIGNSFYLALFVDNNGGDGAWTQFDKLIAENLRTLSLSTEDWRGSALQNTQDPAVSPCPTSECSQNT